MKFCSANDSFVYIYIYIYIYICIYMYIYVTIEWYQSQLVRESMHIWAGRGLSWMVILFLVKSRMVFYNDGNVLCPYMMVWVRN